MEKQEHWPVSCDKGVCEAFSVTRERLRLPPSHVFTETGHHWDSFQLKYQKMNGLLTVNSIFKNPIAKFYLILDVAETLPN